MPLNEFDENGTITARGPVPNVSIHAHMRSGPHAVFEYPLDLVVLTELAFLLAEQNRTPGSQITVTPVAILARLQALGVRSGNGKPIGRDAVYESFARLRAKSYLRLVPLRVNGKAAGVRYEYYDQPAWNPDFVQLSKNAESSQVGAASGNAGSGNAGSRTENRTFAESSQVGAASGIAGSGNAGSRGVKGTSSQVGAASGNAVSPPHPPEEVTTSSPYPHGDRARSHPSQTEGEEGMVFDPKDVFAAESFLQRLPREYALGPQSAKKNGLPLLKAMRSQGWPSIHEVNRDLLTQELTKNSNGFDRPASLVPTRIRDLLLFEVVAPRPTAAAPRRRFIGSGL